MQLHHSEAILRWLQSKAIGKDTTKQNLPNTNDLLEGYHNGEGSVLSPSIAMHADTITSSYALCCVHPWPCPGTCLHGYGNCLETLLRKRLIVTSK